MNQSIPLWKLGLGLIIGGVASGVVLGSADVSTAAGRGQAFGRGLAGLANSWVHEEFVGMGGTTLTIGKGVKTSVDRDSHVLSDGQDVPPNFTN